MHKDDFIVKDQMLFYSLSFFNKTLEKTLGKPGLRVLQADFIKAIGDQDLVGEGMKYDPTQPNKIQGLHHYRLTLDEAGERQDVDVLVKSKMSSVQFAGLIVSLFQQSGLSIDEADVASFAKHFFDKMDSREMGVLAYQAQELALQPFLPKVYGLHEDRDAHDYIVVREFLDNIEMVTNDVDIGCWDEPTIKMALRDFAEFHSVYYNKTDQLVTKDWVLAPPTSEVMLQHHVVWQGLLEGMKPYLGDFIEQKAIDSQQGWIDHLAAWWPRYDALPKTLVYADAQPRNLAMRLLKEDKRLCLFDLETLELSPPQRDVMEFLAYVTTKDISNEKRLEYIEYYRQQLEARTGQLIDKTEHLEACKLSLQHILIYRMSLQIAITPVVKRPDMPRVFSSVWGYMSLF